MRIPLTEPASPRYIHISPATNQVHLMVPVVGGQEISTDNTCKATVALREFFDGGSLRELNTYKSALEFDIGLLEPDDPQRAAKEARFAQIETYIGAISAMQYSYSDVMSAFLTRPSNLYGIQLRPRQQDNQSRVVNPAFNIERKNDANGTPLSALYNAIHSSFSDVAIAVHDPRTRLIHAVSGVLTASSSFEDTQRVLGEQSLALFGLSLDFTQRSDGTPATKAAIDALMGFGNDVTPQDYIEGLLGACTPDVWESLPTPPFYSISMTTPVDERTERLSVLTQFFLANLNVYCKAQGISTQNFGAILDASPDLSHDLVSVASTALSSGDNVERALCDFCNDHAAEFGLSRALNADDLIAIQQKFERTYRTVTATKENPHMDDFMILDLEATGENAKFVTHQGSICVDFAEIIDPVAASANPDYFANIRTDFSTHPAEIPHKNEWVAGEIDIEPEVLSARLNDEQFEKLPETVKEVCHAHLTFQMRQFLHDVAKGKQDEAEALLTAVPANTQTLLRTPGTFTDYSGRTFKCTAYEYAYWAKDTHMCRMLEHHMDEDTKTHLLARIDEIECIDAAIGKPIGLTYQQQGETHCSAHFDFTPLKQALQQYVDGYDGWVAASNRAAMEDAWLNIGKAQRGVPAHVAQEYCRPDRSFVPRPEFNEVTLPRILIFYNWNTKGDDSWFPLTASNSGLGFDFALIRRGGGGVEGGRAGLRWGRGDRDLAAIIRLDEARTVDLTLSREHLNPPAISHDLTM